MPVEFIGGLRVSDADTVEVAKMVLVGKVNKDIVVAHQPPRAAGGGALGRRRPAVPRLDDGRARAARTSASSARSSASTSASSTTSPRTTSRSSRRSAPTASGRSHNVNADEAAGAIARALGAYKVIFLTDVAGWLRDPSDPDSVISECGADEVEAALPTMQGGMRPKLQACIEAIHGGVTFAHIIDGRLPHSLLLELFTDAGIGTKVRPAT